MQTWQIASNPEAYMGRAVIFETQGTTVTGTLEVAFRTDEWDHLIVDGTDYCLTGLETAEIN